MLIAHIIQGERGYIINFSQFPSNPLSNLIVISQSRSRRKFERNAPSTCIIPFFLFYFLLLRKQFLNKKYVKQIYCTWYPRCVSFLPFFFFPSPFSFFLFFSINDYPTVFAFRNEEKKTLHNLRQLQQRFARDWFAEEIGCIWCVRLGIFWPRWVRRKEGERGTEDTELRINVTFRKLSIRVQVHTKFTRHSG